jgi:hypothetical protein
MFADYLWDLAALVAPPLPFPHVKFQHKKACFRGRWQADAARDDGAKRAFDFQF